VNGHAKSSLQVANQLFRAENEVNRLNYYHTDDQ